MTAEDDDDKDDDDDDGDSGVDEELNCGQSACRGVGKYWWSGIAWDENVCQRILFLPLVTAQAVGKQRDVCHEAQR